MALRIVPIVCFAVFSLGAFALTASGGAEPAVAAESTTRLPRAVMLPSDAVEVERSIRFLEARLKKDSEDFVASNKLGGLYLQRLRETGDPTYLTLALKAARESLAALPAEQNTGGLATLAQAEYAGHQFAAARDHAKRLAELEPGKGYPFQILGDALLELGDYNAAKAAYEKMEQLGNIQGLAKVASEQRLARMAALYGDSNGAYQHYANALTLALALAVPPRETVAWCWWQLGETAYGMGDYPTAEQRFRDALTTYPDYFRALASLGRVRAARGDLAAGIDYYKRAIAIIPDPGFVAALGDLLTLNKRPDEAKKQYELVEYIGRLNEINQSLYNRELAYFYADHDIKPKEALAFARRELEYRQDVYAHDLLAWSLYRNGEFDKARAAIEKALALGTKDAKLYFHAGMIHHALNENAKAKDNLARAVRTNPFFHPLLAASAARTLKQLEHNVEDAAVENRQRRE
jgi:tetratricopeptide (TPR) repeat protein